MTDSPQADRSRSAETTRAQEIPRPEVITQLLAVDDTGVVANYIRRLESALQARASSGSPGAAPGAATIREALTCRNGASHYCPNCDNTIDAERIIALAQPPASAPSVATGANEPLPDDA